MTTDFWQRLFGEVPESGLAVRMRSLKKGSRPFLLLPQDGGLASQCLALYPAQTRKARIAKALVRVLLKASLPLGMEPVNLTLSPTSDFVRFLGSNASGAPGTIPQFGVLAGNPANDSQRFLIILFGSQQKPVAVIKAGLSNYARELISKEHHFLSAVRPKTPGVPSLLASFKTRRLNALALPFFAGDSPHGQPQTMLSQILSSWVDLSQALPIAEIPDWRSLEAAADPADLRKLDGSAVRQHRVHPPISHGDFAPWNIKVSSKGEWSVLDWERGQTRGIPGWDWFHYMIQPAILVERLSSTGLIERVEQLLGSEAFSNYAGKAQVTGIERQLVLAYLLYCICVIKPAEGLEATSKLFQAASQRWTRL